MTSGFYKTYREELSDAITRFRYQKAPFLNFAQRSAEDEYLGRIESIIETGSNDVYVVKDSKKEVLIPALASVVLAVDIRRKRMQVELPEGLT